MNWKSPTMIVLYCLIGLTVLSFSLITVLSAFAVVGSVGLILIFAICTWWSFINYLIYKRQKEDARLSDAYLYAEQQEDEQAIKYFSYDKKTERRLKAEKFSRSLVWLAFLTLTIFSVFLTVICIRIL